VSAYQDLQNQVIQFSHAMEQATATEKQLEQTLCKNKDQAAADLEVQLKQQKEATSKLRRRLTELKNELQNAENKKRMLIGRFVSHASAITNSRGR
jgi:predicted  nucleic acid-binding Zn-ribbon protein